MEKILTISIASYNIEKFIRNTVDSLLVPQILEKIEVFIVDDGSVDNTLKIAREYEKKYPNIFHAVHKDNGGYGSTVNYSISHATGKYFKLLDGDDWFCSENLIEFVTFLEKQNADIVLSPYKQVFVKEEKEVISRPENFFEGTKKLTDVSFENVLVMHCLCTKTKLLQEQKKKITEHCFYTDYEFVFLSLLRAETITHFKLPVYCYQLGVEGQSVSIDGIRKHYFDKSKVANQIYNWYRENNPDSYQGFHKKLLLREILGITNDAYCAYMTLENVKIGKKELIDFDKNMKKEFPEIYKETMSVKKIRLLRETHFLAFHYLRKRYLKVFGSN